MIEMRDPSSNAILFKKSPEEKKVEKLEEELQRLKELVEGIGAKVSQSPGKLP